MKKQGKRRKPKPTKRSKPQPATRSHPLARSRTRADVDDDIRDERQWMDW